MSGAPTAPLASVTNAAAPPAKRRRSKEGTATTTRRKSGKLSRFVELCSVEIVLRILCDVDPGTLLAISRTSKAWHGALCNKLTGRPSSSPTRSSFTDAAVWRASLERAYEDGLPRLPDGAGLNEMQFVSLVFSTSCMVRLACACSR